MSNLALKKLPIEGNIWQNPQEATNGKTTNYGDFEGFAFASWPCSFTIDLEEEHSINTIRFLLWDNLGKDGNKLQNRKYKFSLSISSDGINYTTIYSNQHLEGGNGWFSFRLLNETYARFIKLSGHFNSANRDIHIVEFEVHDTEPQEVTSKNYHQFDIVTGIPGEKTINDLIDQSIAKKSELLQGVEEKIQSLNTTLKQSSEALEQIEFIKHSHDFQKESLKNNTRSNYWLFASSLTLTIFIVILLWFVFCDKHSISIITDASKDNNIKPFTSILLGAYYVSKALLLSTLLFMLGWFLKNYRSERHNYVINKHKAMTLTVATGILTKDEYKSTNRASIFDRGMDIIFTHQVSGFSIEENSSPSIVNTLLQKDIPKTD